MWRTGAAAAHCGTVRRKRQRRTSLTPLIGLSVMSPRVHGATYSFAAYDVTSGEETLGGGWRVGRHCSEAARGFSASLP